MSRDSMDAEGVPLQDSAICVGIRAGDAESLGFSLQLRASESFEGHGGNNNGAGVAVRPTNGVRMVPAKEGGQLVKPLPMLLPRPQEILDQVEPGIYRCRGQYGGANGLYLQDQNNFQNYNMLRLQQQSKRVAVNCADNTRLTLQQQGYVYGGNGQMQYINDNRGNLNDNQWILNGQIPPYSLELSGGAGYFTNLLTSAQIPAGRGPLQDLLRQVSSSTISFQSAQFESCIQQGGLLGIHGIGSPSAPAVHERESDNSSGEMDDSESENENEEEDRYAADEDTDAIVEETRLNWLEIEKKKITYEEADLQFECVDVIKQREKNLKRRRRFPNGVEVPDYRKDSQMGTIEKAMRNAENRTTEHIFEPKLGMVFDSRIEAYKFYNLYSWEVGFGVRFGPFARNRVNKMRTMQKIVCERQGFDARCKTSSTRINCQAMIKLHRTEDMGWYISKHVASHNHPTSLTCGEKREWNSHSKIENSTKNIIKYLRDNNVSLSRVHCFMGSMYGSMQNVPFNQKSLRAVCAQIAKDAKDDDIGKTLEIFRKMRAEDPGFQFSVDLDKDKKIKTLLWACGRSRSQYNYFGDAITFDTTYCTNIYKMPFGMFVGVNNHFQSILFAGVMMKNEDTESFKWVFKEFVTLMGGKHPVTILTDQCKAMTKAIKEVYTEGTTHLWCKWHVLRYAPEELGTVYRNNGPFKKEFHYVINQMLTVDEFEKAWHDLVERYGLQENDFMKRTYEKREKWAKPWARNTFCARMASTQRSESANSILKKVVPRNSSINRFVEQYRKMIFLRTAAEQKAEHQTKQFVHRAKRCYDIERHALSVYTKNSFELFSEEVDKATDYVVSNGLEPNSYLVKHNNAKRRKGWARVLFSVKVEPDGKRYYCECGQYEHFGILCCHVIKVMVVNGVQEIPEAHIMKRWTRNARDFKYQDEICNSAGKQIGQNLLYASALELVNSTEENPKAGEILLKYLSMAKREIDDVKGIDFNRVQPSDGNCSDELLQLGNGTETETCEESGYDSNAQGILCNTYGASGSSAYMSDADIIGIQMPEVPEQTGRRREKRFMPLFERKRKGRKRYPACPEFYEANGQKKKGKKT